MAGKKVGWNLSIETGIEVKQQDFNRASRIFDTFYNKYNNRNVVIDTSDMIEATRDGISEIKKLYEDGTKESTSWLNIRPELKSQFEEIIGNAEAMFSEIKVMFNDGSYVSGLGNVLNGFRNQLSIVFSDIGGLYDELNQRQKGLVDGIGGSIFVSDYDDQSDIRNRIDALQELIEIQTELSKINPNIRADDFASGVSTNRLRSELANARSYYEEMTEYELEFSDQVYKRRTMIQEANEFDWGEYAHDEYKDNKRYSDAIDELNNYISQKRQLIDRFKEEESELFKVDGIEGYISQINYHIEQYEAYRKEFESLRDAELPDEGSTINLKPVIYQLEQIAKAISDIQKAFKPLTDAMSAGDSALHKMLTASIDDINTLQQKFEQLGKTIESIGKKEFNITNITQTGGGVDQASEALRQYKKIARELGKQVAALYQEAGETYAIGGTKLNNAYFQLIGNLASGDQSSKKRNITYDGFQLNSVLNAINKATGLDEVDATIDQLNHLKKLLLDFNELRNQINPGSFVNGYKDIQKIEGSDIGSLTNVVEQSKQISDSIEDANENSFDRLVSQVGQASETIKLEIESIKDAINNAFDLSAINPNYEHIKTITDTIYKQFVKLQSDINALQITINAPDEFNALIEANKKVAESMETTGEAGEKAEEGIKKEGDAAESAAQKKNEFTESNKNAADSMKKTGESGKDAAAGIEEEENAAEMAANNINNAYGKINKSLKNGYVKINGTSYEDFESFATTLASSQNMTIDDVSVVADADDKVKLATIKMVNEELAQSVVYTYEILKVEEGVSSAYLARYKASSNINKAYKIQLAAEKKAAAEQLKLDKAKAKNNEWLIKQQSKLDTQERRYKHSNKQIDGSQIIMSTETSLESVVGNADKTIDDLAKHIRESIQNVVGGNLTDGIKEQILNDIRILQNEIAVAQNAKYSATNMKASSVETNKKAYKEYLAAFKANAKKANIFDEMASSIESLEQEIDKVTDSDGLNAFIDSLKVARNKFAAEKAKHIENEQSYNDIVKAQEKMYSLRKELVGLDKDSAKGKETTRKLTEAQREFNEVLSKSKNLTAEQRTSIHALGKQQKDEVKTLQKEKDLKDLHGLYEKQAESAAKIAKYRGQLQLSSTSDAEKERLKEKIREEQQIIVNIQKQIVGYGELYTKEEQLAAITKEREKALSKIKDEQAKDKGKQEKEDEVKAAKAQKEQVDLYENILKIQEKLYKLKKDMVGLDIESSRGQEAKRNLDKTQKEYDEAMSKKNSLTVGQLESIRILKEKQEEELRTKRKEYADQVSTEQEEKDLKYVLALYKKYTDAAQALKKMQSDPTGAAHTERMASSIEEIKKAKQDLLDLGIDVNNILESELLTESQKIALLEEQIKYKKQIKDIEDASSDKIETKENRQNQNYGKTIFNRESRYLGQIGGYLESYEDASFSSEFLSKLEKYTDAYKELEGLRNKFANNPSASNDKGLRDQFQSSALGVERLRKELISAFKEYEKFLDIPKDALIGVENIDTSAINNAKFAMMDFADSVTNGQFKFEGFNEAGTEMYGVLDKGNGHLQKITVSLNSVTNEMVAFYSGTKQATNSWSQLGSELKKGIGSLVSRYVGISEALQAVKQGLNYVKEIDLAMTELKKVTDETDQTYKNFLKTASSTASAIGSTVSDFTDATAAFARLGSVI